MGVWHVSKAKDKSMEATTGIQDPKRIVSRQNLPRGFTDIPNRSLVWLL